MLRYTLWNIKILLNQRASPFKYYRYVYKITELWNILWNMKAINGYYNVVLVRK